MNGSDVILTLSRGEASARVDGSRVHFSAHQCFRFDDHPSEIACLKALGSHLAALPSLAVFGDTPLLHALLKHAPEIEERIQAMVADPRLRYGGGGLSCPVVSPEAIPEGIAHVFLCETMTVPRLRMRDRLPARVQVVEPDLLVETARDLIPLRAWTPIEKSIYPIKLPEIVFRRGLDLLVVDCPSRNLALMPNGLGYLDNALKKTSVSYQIADLDIIAYHRYHMTRLFDLGGQVVLRSGRVLPNDPWLAEHYDIWTSGSEMTLRREGHSDVLEYFRPFIDEVVSNIVEAAPKVLGFSIQQCNEAICKEIVQGVKAALPETLIVVGGFSCYSADVGRRIFPECDYMCIGEAELTVGPLAEALARGERPFDLPGIISRFDTPDRRYVPGPMPHNLDQIEFPKYDWSNLDLYRNYNGYQLTPIIASRGCRWSRCTFCAERFYWRIRSPRNFADELEWLVSQGCTLFMFNESDLNGMPEKLLDICDEIIRRGLHRKVKLTGQLRIHKKADRAFYRKLHAAGFVALRFGVDAFSENTLRLQKKGYTVDMIRQNLRDCWEAGIYTEVNWVIGVPGESDQDVEEGIQLILENRNYIGRVCNINPLILVNGGVYWLDPEAHGIVFREPKEQLYQKFPRAIPAELWYSVDPHIDGQVRKERFERIVIALHEAGFPVGPWAEKIIDVIQRGRDPMRGGGKDEDGAAPPAINATPGGELAELRRGRVQKTIPIGSTLEEPPEPDAPLVQDAKPPRMIRAHAGYRIVYFNAWYYGVPLARGDVDVSGLDAAGMEGIPRDTTEEGLVRQIDSAARWANSRGHFEDQERQRAEGSYLRVNSLLGDGYVAEEMSPDSTILSFGGEKFAVCESAVAAAFRLAAEAQLPRDIALSETTWLRRAVSRVLPRGLLFGLKRVFLDELKREKRPRRLSGELINPPTDIERLSLLTRGIVRAGAGRFRALISGSDSSAARPRERSDMLKIAAVVTKGAAPELMWSTGGYNVVKFDGAYYGLPHGLEVDWSSHVASLPGALCAKSAREVLDAIERIQGGNEAPSSSSVRAQRTMGPAGERSAVPRLLGSMEGYNLVEYEGWIYGLPTSLGAVDLTEVDVIETEGVIRDVSRDVVENEIMERARMRQVATVA